MGYPLRGFFAAQFCLRRAAKSILVHRMRWRKEAAMRARDWLVEGWRVFSRNRLLFITGALALVAFNLS